MNDILLFGGGATVIAMAILLVHGAVAVQYVSAGFGIVGALVLAIPGIDPAAGFAAFLASNIGWLLFSARREHWGLFLQQAVFLITSLVGLWNWWLGPLVLG